MFTAIICMKEVGGCLRPQDSLLEKGQETICAVSVNTLAK